MDVGDKRVPGRGQDWGLALAQQGSLSSDGGRAGIALELGGPVRDQGL